MDRIDQARNLMLAFADATGITGERAARRYLWTDAHAVCNFLALEAQTGETDFRRLALALVDQVHRTLGRHRDDDERTGWISGLDDAAGERRPTAGGLRIGKPLPERDRQAPFDERAEWDQDGQYYHYLTKWMHALRSVARATGQTHYLDWAVELAEVAYAAFHAPAGPPRLYWKMSIDLSYPLVPSSGLHDPLDGLVTALTLASAARTTSEDAALDHLIADLGVLCRGARWETGDSLGIGGLLFDACRLTQLDASLRATNLSLLGHVLDAAVISLRAYRRTAELDQPAWRRLAFRELGLAIGLHAVEIMYAQELPGELLTRLDDLQRHTGVAASIEGFWLDPGNRGQATWRDHQDISDVMLATSLLPAGMLRL